MQTLGNLKMDLPHRTLGLVHNAVRCMELIVRLSVVAKPAAQPDQVVWFGCTNTFPGTPTNNQNTDDTFEKYPFVFFYPTRCRQARRRAEVKRVAFEGVRLADGNAAGRKQWQPLAAQRWPRAQTRREQLRHDDKGHSLVTCGGTCFSDQVSQHVVLTLF